MRVAKSSTFAVLPATAAAGHGGGAGWRVAAVSAVGQGGARPDVTLHDVPVPADAPPADVAAAVARALATLGYRGQGVVLAAPSAWCLWASVAPPASGRRRRQAMRFRLEEKLPVAAEEMAADFVESPGGGAGGGAAFGVGMPADLAGTVVDALESAGVRVEAICPAALLAAQAVVDNLAGGGGDLDVVGGSDSTASPRPTVAAPVPPSARDACVWADGDRLELVELADGRPAGWYVLPRRPAALALRLGAAAGARTTGGPLNVLLVGAEPAVAEAARRVAGVAVVATGGPAMAAAAAVAAARVSGGRLAPWVDLREGPLAAADPLRRFRRPLAAAVAAGLLCLACAAGALFWRAGQYRAMARQFAADQEAAFRQAFPGQPLPAAPVARLASEERRLAAAAGGATGGGAGTAGGPQSASALPVLYAALARMPEDVRYRVAELRVADGKLTIEGQAKTHADAQGVADALRADDGFRVELPRTDQTGGDGPTGSVGFVLAAVPGPGAAYKPDPSAAAGAAPGRPSSVPPTAASARRPAAPPVAAAGKPSPAGGSPPPPARPAAAAPPAGPPVGAGLTTAGFGITAAEFAAHPVGPDGKRITTPLPTISLTPHVGPITEWPPKLPKPPAVPSPLATPPANRAAAGGNRPVTRPVAVPPPPPTSPSPQNDAEPGGRP